MVPRTPRPSLARAALRTWAVVARLRSRARQRLSPAPQQESWARRFAPQKSFLDVGCMWNAHARVGFAAEQAGAARVTGLDLMAPTDRFNAEHAHRDSRLHFIQGDLHDPDVIQRVGVHDVVWCSGVLYHAPHPLLTLQRLCELTGETLILATETIPELPGSRGACIFYPGLAESERRIHASLRPGRLVGLSEPFDPDARYGNWYWGISPSALAGMLAATGFEIVERDIRPLHATVVARVRARDGQSSAASS